MRWPRSLSRRSLLGLSFAGGRMRACQVTLTRNGGVIAKSASAPLALDLLHPEIDLISRELKNHLEEAQIRTRACVVAVPDGWVLSQHTAVPDLTTEDMESLLRLEAEASFPCDPAQLQIGRVVHRTDLQCHVTQLAVRREQIDHLTAVLTGAGLKPLSFSLGLAALPGVISGEAEGRITLSVEPSGATLLVCAKGAVTAYRSLDASAHGNTAEQFSARTLAREVRITFEQLPADLREGITMLGVIGEHALVAEVTEALAHWAREARLSLSPGPQAIADQIPEQLAARYLAHGAPAIEFLSPRRKAPSRLPDRFGSRHLMRAALGAVALAAVTALLFGWQEYRRRSLRAKWTAIADQVKSVEAVHQYVRDYRPWCDATPGNLRILRLVTECFPEDGSVTARVVEIHGLANVTVSGVAHDHAALLRILDALRQAREVNTLKIDQIRGKIPAQFTFTFRWNPSPRL